MDLTAQKCVPCEGGTKPLTRSEYMPYLQTIVGWEIEDDVRISKELKFKNFMTSLEFVNKVGAIAEAEGHHPDINLHGWNKVGITLSTHAVSGLSINDFILAAKIDQALSASSS